MSVKPRFEMIPSGYDVGVLGSQVPNTSEGDFTVERTGVATRVNAQGLIEEVAPNVPRLDYSDGGGCPKLLTEVGSENLITYSEDFSSVAWNVSNSTVSIHPTILSPDGNLNATHVISSGYLGVVQLSSNIAPVGGSKSIWIRTVSGTGYVTALNYSTNTNALMYITSEWKRLEVSDLGESFWERFYAVDFRGAGTTVTECLIFGAQLEQGDLTSYIPTNGATQQRGADSVTGAGDASTFNSEAGYLFADVKALSGNDESIGMNSGDALNRIMLNFRSNEVRFVSTNNEVNQLLSQSYDIVMQNKYICAYNGVNGELYINGIKFKTSSLIQPLNPNVLTQISFNDGVASKSTSAKTKSLQHGNALTDDQYEAMTGYTSYQDIANQFGFKQL